MSAAINKLRGGITMNPYSYEYSVAAFLQNNGYKNVRVTKASGDYGVDITAVKGKKKYAVQCKYYSNPVGLSAVQEVVAGKSMYGCDSAMVITNTVFTQPAKNLAAQNGVELMEHVWGSKAKYKRPFRFRITPFELFIIIMALIAAVKGAIILYEKDVLWAVILIFIPIIFVLFAIPWLIHRAVKRSKEAPPKVDKKKAQAAAEAVAEIHEIVERMDTYTNDIHQTVAYMRGETKELPPDRPIPKRDAEIFIDPNDSLEDQIISYILQSQTTTLSAIQRKFKLGQVRAWHIMDSIEELGIIGPQIGSLPRPINISYEEWLDKRGYYEALRMERSDTYGENRKAPQWEL